METAECEVWIDVGGTFTDCFVQPHNRPRSSTKILSSGRVPISAIPQSQRVLQSQELANDCARFWCGAKLHFLAPSGQSHAVRQVIAFEAGSLTLDDDAPAESNLRHELSAVEAPVLGVRRLLNCPLAERLPPLKVRLGTTRGTNALLTRTGAKTAIAITSPFEDLLRIGDQTRANLFALAITQPEPLVSLTLGIAERLDAAGNVLVPIDPSQTRHLLQAARQQGCTSLAICLMHSYLNPSHELQVLQLAQDMGFEYIACSSQIAPLIEIVARAQTGVVDAYLSPIIAGYLTRLIDQFGGANQVDLQVMTSAGGLVDFRNFSGKDCILSGPAGGVAALRAIAKATRRRELIGLDMGGTSTDVCRVGGQESLQYESTKAGVRILAPTLPIETVASGGGSICWFDGVSLRVGPQSAGASPGPACYGRGGPLTLTDLNVYLNRIPHDQFPFPIDLASIQQRLSQLLAESGASLGMQSPQELATGFRRIANEQMAEAVRTVSIAQGLDPRGHALVGFGGAAGQHICEIADLLEIRTVIDSADSGMLSALGMGLATIRRDAVVSVYSDLDDCAWEALEELIAKNISTVDLSAETGGEDQTIRHGRELELRYRGTDVSLTVPWMAREEVRSAFETAHRKRFGYIQPGRPLELVAIRLNWTVPSVHSLPAANRLPPVDLSLGERERQLAKRTSVASHAAANSAAIAVIPRNQLLPGDRLEGPAIVANQGSTLFVELDWQAEVLSDGTLDLRRRTANNLPSDNTTHTGGGALPSTQDLDPVFRDCFAQRLSAIATQMGLVLQQTAISVNVKQRRDFSCAVFDSAGHLLANAPHVPVHLGAMGRTVREILQEFPSIQAGDCFLTNDPYRGGSHLPDITVVTPVFDEAVQPPELIFFVANRAHHADVGGKAPGSMSVQARRLGDEGAIIPPMKLADAGEDCTFAVRSLLESCIWPPRNIDENLADLAAQQAANERGVSLLRDYAEATGWSILRQYSTYLLDAAEQRVRNFIRDELLPSRTAAGLPSTMHFSDELDDGTAIMVDLKILSDARLRIDFSGSGPVSPTNFNANASIVSAAIMYVLRCLIADELPLNEGVMRCVDLVLPVGVLNPQAAANAEDSPAVAAGNVETSQRVVDVLLGALGVAAASQGTMNNLLFGNTSFGFYETICGGSGATAGHHGASGVHTHMTNTRLTDPEVLEARYPVRLQGFGLRTASGGAGCWHGGDGVYRTIEFLQDVDLSLLTSRRGVHRPFGLAGGEPGQAGHNLLRRGDGQSMELPACCQLQVKAGDQLTLQTPGGGGYGTIHAATAEDHESA